MDATNTYRELNRFIVQFVMKLYESGDYQGLREIGLSSEEARRIVELSGHETIRLTGFHAPIARVEITGDIRRILDYVRLESSRERTIEQLIQLGASQPMLQELAGVDHREYQERRRSLGLIQGRAGRPPLLNDDELTVVHHAWNEYRGENNPLQRYLYVALRIRSVLKRDIPLSQVWQHLKT